MPTLSKSEAPSAIESLKRFFLQKENSESDIKALDKMRSRVENQMFAIQPNIDNFLSNKRWLNLYQFECHLLDCIPHAECTLQTIVQHGCSRLRMQGGGG